MPREPIAGLSVGREEQDLLRVWELERQDEGAVVRVAVHLERQALSARPEPVVVDAPQGILFIIRVVRRKAWIALGSVRRDAQLLVEWERSVGVDPVFVIDGFTETQFVAQCTRHPLPVAGNAGQIAVLLLVTLLA